MMGVLPESVIVQLIDSKEKEREREREREREGVLKLLLRDGHCMTTPSGNIPWADTLYIQLCHP